MEKGWGLTLESDPINNFFSNSYNTSNSTHNNSMFSGYGFPMNLSSSCKEEDQTASRPSDNDDDGDHDHNRMAVNELDFFSDRKRDHITNTMTSASNITTVKKENSPAQSLRFDVNTGLRLLTANNTRSDQYSMADDGVSPDAPADDHKKAKNELMRLQGELERMNVENQRLKGMLAQVGNNYNTLQTHLGTLMQQQQQNNSSTPETTNDQPRQLMLQQHKKHDQVGEAAMPRQFLELGPSVTPPPPPLMDTNEQSYSTSEERTHSGSPINNANVRKEIPQPYDQDKAVKGVGRDESPESEGWTSNKVAKLNNNSKSTIDQGTAEATMRKARVSVRARSEAPMITDGCQWRKYGQKMAKGNPCPRAYYRCTMAVGCPVRKQVQRCAEDRTILITTYEGNHNHPLPPAAMAMASTTSAAASMLLSGSMPSADGLMNPNLLARAILPCSTSMATISASAPFPTVTLDLTHTPSPLQFQRPPTPFQIPYQTQPHNFSSVPTNPNFPLHNQSKFSGLHVSQNNDSSALAQQQQQHPTLADSVTAAIASDPNFTAALAAAITSIMGGGGQQNNNGTTAASMGTSNSSMSNSFQGN